MVGVGLFSREVLLHFEMPQKQRKTKKNKKIVAKLNRFCNYNFLKVMSRMGDFT